MLAIFLSYRRDDAEGEAGRLFRDLTTEFGAGKVFIDVSGIEYGADFRKVIEKNVEACGVVLTMIGKNWIDARDEAGQRRLDDPMDFVRIETASALKRDIRVIPVLVHGGRMPQPQQLPEDIRDLAYRNGVELTHARWDYDVQVLINALRPHVASKQAGVKGDPAPHRGLPLKPAAADFADAGGSTKAADEPITRASLWRGVAIAAVAAIVLTAGTIGAYKYVRTEEASVRRAAKEAAAKQAAEDQQAGADEDKAAVPNMAGTWLETYPNDASHPLRLKIEQNGSEADVYISYTQVFDGNPFLRARISHGTATQSIGQDCASAYQKPGYNYDNPGVNIFSISLSGSHLVYEQDTKWTSPCDGHPIGLEKDVRELHRVEAKN